MEQNAVVKFRHRQSPSSDRFLGVFSPPQNETPLGTDDDNNELNEDDVFWTGSDVTESQLPHSFRPPEKSGILAALSEDHRNPNFPVLRRKPTGAAPLSQSPISRAIPLIPKPPSETCNYSKSMPVTVRKFQNSAPVNVPIMMQKKLKRKGQLDEEDDEEEEEEMLPPHEIVDRGSIRSLKTTFSVLEGVGRTLKGRDLRQVRNAVWRQTGFQD